jgi:oligopeptide transport system ATP-binding protein
VGESGCGKSTLLRALLGVTPKLRIHAGTVTLDGTELTALPNKARRAFTTERMGTVSQDPGASFMPIRTYRAQFIETLKCHGKYDPATFNAQAAEMLSRLSLTEAKRVLDSCPFELSGGMNQRVALALALLLGQELLLADEPISALDATVGLQVAEELKRLRDEQGIAQLVVTHSLALARHLADRIGVMYSGRLVELAEAEALLADPQHPYTLALLSAVPTLSGAMPTPLPGQPPMHGPAETGCEFAPRCAYAGPGCVSAAYALEDIGGGHLVACGKEDRP